MRKKVHDFMLYNTNVCFFERIMIKDECNPNNSEKNLAKGICES